MCRAGVCPMCGRELVFKKLFGFTLKWCKNCLEYKKKDKSRL